MPDPSTRLWPGKGQSPAAIPVRTTASLPIPRAQPVASVPDGGGGTAPPGVPSLRGYVVRLPLGKVALWCYLVWYLVVVSRYFDPSPRIWLNAVGISGVIGVALWLGVRQPAAGRFDRWQVFRLFLTPFCVSSFSALIKGQGFILVFPPHPGDLALAFAACAGFVAVVLALKRLWREPGV